MAERRMFAKTIVTSDAFLDMPLSARCLYFTLGMFADDDGFVNNPKSIMRQVGASNDDMNILLSKKFVIIFESGIIVIKHWRINNYLRSDRYVETKYTEEKSLLRLEENGAYTLDDDESTCAIGKLERQRNPLTDAQRKRLEAKKDSDLPASFDCKIRNAFIGKKCPICGRTMSYSNNLTRPTIQHNLPISLGGKHEINNISVICSSCNSSAQNRIETPPYNTEEVKEVWEHIGNGLGMDTEYSIEEDSIGKISIDKESDENFHTMENFATPTQRTDTRFKKPTVEEISEYCRERNNGIDAQRFFDYYEAKGWLIGKTKMKDWRAAVRTWERGSGAGVGTATRGGKIDYEAEMTDKEREWLKGLDRDED